MPAQADEGEGAPPKQTGDWGRLLAPASRRQGEGDAAGVGGGGLGDRRARFQAEDRGEVQVTLVNPQASTHPGGNPWANLQSISHRCYLREVAFEWELTKETIYLPLGCLQDGSGRHFFRLQPPYPCPLSTEPLTFES